jgi:hypothetical protein
MLVLGMDYTEVIQWREILWLIGEVKEG